MTHDPVDVDRLAEENTTLRSILRKIVDARVANLYELTVSDGTGIAMTQLTYTEAALWSAITTEETP